MTSRATITGRSALIWGVASFLALQVGLAVAIENWWPELRDPRYGHRIHLLRRRTVDVASRPPTVIMLGTSRAELGLRGHLIEESLTAELDTCPIVFNFALAGASHLTELVILERLLAEGIQPDLVLIEVLPPILAGQAPSAETTRHTAETLFLRDLSVLFQFTAPSRDWHTHLWEEWSVPWFSCRFEILKRAAPWFVAGRFQGDAYQLIDASGSMPMADVIPTAELQRAAVERARSEYAHFFAGFRVGGSGAQALRAILDRCRQERLAAALVLMPEGNAFRDFYPPETWAQIHAFLGGLSNEFHVPLVDARDWIDDSRFYDSHHLVLAGADAFSDRLGREYIAPFLRSRRP